MSLFEISPEVNNSRANDVGHEFIFKVCENIIKKTIKNTLVNFIISPFVDLHNCT